MLPSTLGIGLLDEAGVHDAENSLWHEVFDIVFVPHPDFSNGQQAVVAKDRGMTDGRAVLTVRYAMLFYVLKRLGLLENARGRNSRTEQIVAANAPELGKVLKRAKFEFDEAKLIDEVRE